MRRMHPRQAFLSEPVFRHRGLSGWERNHRIARRCQARVAAHQCGHPYSDRYTGHPRSIVLRCESRFRRRACRVCLNTRLCYLESDDDPALFRSGSVLPTASPLYPIGAFFGALSWYVLLSVGTASLRFSIEKIAVDQLNVAIGGLVIGIGVGLAFDWL
jgi:hypothetical protein